MERQSGKTTRMVLAGIEYAKAGHRVMFVFASMLGGATLIRSILTQNGYTSDEARDILRMHTVHVKSINTVRCEIPYGFGGVDVIAVDHYVREKYSRSYQDLATLIAHKSLILVDEFTDFNEENQEDSMEMQKIMLPRGNPFGSSDKESRNQQTQENSHAYFEF